METFMMWHEHNMATVCLWSPWLVLWMGCSLHIAVKTEGTVKREGPTYSARSFMSEGDCRGCSGHYAFNSGSAVVCPLTSTRTRPRFLHRCYFPCISLPRYPFLSFWATKAPTVQS